MATLIEQRNLHSYDLLKNRVEQALINAATVKLLGAPTPDELIWAVAVLGNPRAESKKAFMVVIAANKGATVQQIKGAPDSAIEANIDAVVPALVVAHVASVVGEVI